MLLVFSVFTFLYQALECPQTLELLAHVPSKFVWDFFFLFFYFCIPETIWQFGEKPNIGASKPIGKEWRTALESAKEGVRWVSGNTLNQTTLWSRWEMRTDQVTRQWRQEAPCLSTGSEIASLFTLQGLEIHLIRKCLTLQVCLFI